MRVRAANPGDADALAGVVAEGFDGYRAFAPPGWEPPSMVLEAARIRAELARRETWCEVVEHDGEVVGHVAIMSARNHPLGTAADADTAHLWQLFLRRAFWGNGAAARLLADALDEALVRGYRSIRLFTPEGQARARRFYEREGFALVGAPFDAGLGIPLVEYRRALAR